MASCKTCDLPARSRVDALLAAGSSVRSVARMFAIPRSSLARHARHVPPLDRKLGLIPPPPIEDPRVDPLDAAYALIERAKTERERLKALEAVRGATVLRLREMGTPDEEALQLLDDNVAAAMSAYRDGGESFEHAIRGLQGLREAIRQRIDVVRAPEGIPVQWTVTFADSAGHISEPPGPLRGEEPVTVVTPLADYFRGIPKRFWDPRRYAVARTTFLSFTERVPREELKVYEAGSDVLVWSKGPRT